MGYRLLLLLMVLLLAPAGYLLVVPVQELGAMGGLIRLPEIPAPATPKSMAKLELESPLGILVLDQSRSMVTNDPEFIQSLASEVFAYFYAHLIKEDTAPGSEEKIHLATLFYPRINHREAVTMKGLDLSVLFWPAPTGGDKRWLRVEASTAGASQASAAIQQRFEAVMGKQGQDLRNGGNTPHEDVGPGVVALVQDYRQRMGANAEIYAVYMTDEGDNPGFPAARQHILQNLPGVKLASAPLKNSRDADNLIPSFLRALQLDEIDVTKEASGAGFDMTTFGGRPVPFLVSSSVKPEVMTDAGVPVPVYGRNGLFYGICDPKDAQFAKSRLLKITPGWGAETVRVFRRPWWELKMQPHYYDMLDANTVPEAMLNYVSGNDPENLCPRNVEVTTRNGQILAHLTLNWDAASRSFTGRLPGPDVFPASETEFILICKQDKGEKLQLPFTALRAVRLRYVDRSTGKTSRTADHLSFFPMHHKP